MLKDSPAVINVYLNMYQSSQCTFGVAESEYVSKEVWEFVIKQNRGSLFTTSYTYSHNYN